MSLSKAVNQGDYEKLRLIVDVVKSENQAGTRPHEYMAE
jgi:hypothetical protein